jgi:hypothetical protein
MPCISTGVSLTEIFDFFGVTPLWAHSSADLITFTRNASKNLEWAPVNLFSECWVPGFAIGHHIDI